MIRDHIHNNISIIVATFDAHDPGILGDEYRCPQPCRWTGTQTQWHQHLADALADALTTETVELPERNL